MSDVTFSQLRAANLARIPLFKNAQGELCHSSDGSDWSIAQWTNAVTGELGEFANIIKKIDRGDFTLADKQQEIADELADIQTYLDILAYRCGVDLGAATRNKFNRVSERVGAPVKMLLGGTVSINGVVGRGK